MTSEEVCRTGPVNFWFEPSQLPHNPVVMDSPHAQSSYKATVHGAEHPRARGKRPVCTGESWAPLV